MPYIGYSMSEGAADAYENGEKPKSAWSKNAMMDVITTIIEEEGLNLDHQVFDAFPKSSLFALFFKESSWHHTGTFYNKTDFYALDYMFVRGLTNQRLYDMLKEVKEKKRRQKSDKLKALPRYVEVKYLQWSGSRNHPKATEIVARGYIKGQWFTSNAGVRKNIYSAGFEVLEEIDHLLDKELGW